MPLPDSARGSSGRWGLSRMEGWGPWPLSETERVILLLVIDQEMVTRSCNLGFEPWMMALETTSVKASSQAVRSEGEEECWRRKSVK